MAQGVHLQQSELNQCIVGNFWDASTTEPCSMSLIMNVMLIFCIRGFASQSLNSLRPGPHPLKCSQMLPPAMCLSLGSHYIRGGGRHTPEVKGCGYIEHL